MQQVGNEQIGQHFLMSKLKKKKAPPPTLECVCLKFNERHSEVALLLEGQNFPIAQLLMIAQWANATMLVCRVQQ